MENAIATMSHLISRPSSPHSSALPSPPSSPGSSFSSLPSSAFSLSVPSSPPHHESPLPHAPHSLIIPSLSLDSIEQPIGLASHAVNSDSLGHVKLLVVGAKGSGKTFLAETLMHGNDDLFSTGDWVDEPGLGRVLVAAKSDNETTVSTASVRIVECPGFEQSDDPNTILGPLLDTIHSPFQDVLPLLSTTHPADTALRDLLASPYSQFYTAALLMTSSPPTPLENTLISSLSTHLPVLPVPSPTLIHPARARARPPRTRARSPRSRTPHHLRTMLFCRPSALRALRSEAADRFLRWRELENPVDEKRELWEDATRASYASGKHANSDAHCHAIDPLHVRSVVLASLSLLRPLAASLGMRWWVIGAFCAGVGVGWLLGAGAP